MRRGQWPLSGIAGGWARSWSKASERRHRRRIELYKIRNQAVQAEQASQAQVAALMAAHAAVNRRWLDGLIVLPEATIAALEVEIVGELNAPHTSE